MRPGEIPLSKQDSQFFNMFSIVIGVLVAIALVLFAIARSIGNPFEEQRAMEDQKVQRQIVERIAPVGRVAVAGQDNSALAIVAANQPEGGAPAAALPANGEETYKQVCATCHTAGIAGAPKSGDKAAWAPRIAQGTTTLYDHAIKGFQGKGGVMPAKGGRTDLPDELVRETVDYMVKLNQ
jgi:cytochrome c5